MGIFGTSSPFDQDVERATSENNTSEEWGLILEICDRAGASAQASRDCLRAVMRRLAHPDPHVQVHAATLLDACVNNCGRVFHLEIASREFETEFRRLVSRAQPAIATKLKSMLRKWAEGEFRSDPQLDLIPALAKQLRAEAEPAADKGQGVTAAAAAAAQREQEELSRAIAASLKEPSRAKLDSEELARAIAASLRESGPSAAPSSSLYPRVDDVSQPQPQPQTRKVRAMYDFEAAEDNELTFFSGEIFHVTDSSDPNWWKGYNERGEGLFPANFVTFDLADPTPKSEPRGAKSVQFSDSTRAVLEQPPPPAEIDEAAMDAALAALHDADVEARGEESSLLALESRVLAMGPLVDAALQRADTRHARLTQLSAELVRALNLYHELMRAPPQPSQPPQQYPPQGFHPQPPRC